MWNRSLLYLLQQKSMDQQEYGDVHGAGGYCTQNNRRHLIRTNTPIMTPPTSRTRLMMNTSTHPREGLQREGTPLPPQPCHCSSHSGRHDNGRHVSGCAGSNTNGSANGVLYTPERTVSEAFLEVPEDDHSYATPPRTSRGFSWGSVTIGYVAEEIPSPESHRFGSDSTSFSAAGATAFAAAAAAAVAGAAARVGGGAGPSRPPTPAQPRKPSKPMLEACGRSKAFFSGTPAPSCNNNNQKVLKYYPPPINDSVDVIEHGGEVLIVRREPPLPSRGLTLLQLVIEEEVTESTMIQDDGTAEIQNSPHRSSPQRSSPHRSGTEGEVDMDIEVDEEAVLEAATNRGIEDPRLHILPHETKDLKSPMDEAKFDAYLAVVGEFAV